MAVTEPGSCLKWDQEILAGAQIVELGACTLQSSDFAIKSYQILAGRRRFLQCREGLLQGPVSEVGCCLELELQGQVQTPPGRP